MPQNCVMRIFTPLALVVASLLVGCGGTEPSGFQNDAGTVDPDSTTPPDDSGQPIFPDSSVETAPPCVGLKCQQVTCVSGKTTVSGTVYDPAGFAPLYGVVVYIPNAPLDPIKHGPVCDSCGGANVSGNPIVTALTDPKGKFVLSDVPVGANIPLVMQVGKWRRQITIPNVASCVDTAVTDKNLTRLPKKQSEGDMPRIALATGCDPMETLIKKIGIDPTEFTNGTGTGAVHVYTGKTGPTNVAPGQTDAYVFWADKTKMMTYDIIINECECSPYARPAGAYQNMADYLNAGGRMFGSHYHINWFSDPTAAADLKAAATWTPWGSCGTAPYLIDQSFPKGKAMADWMKNVFPASVPAQNGQLNVTSGCIVKDIGATVPGISQRWVYQSASPSPPAYISINTPTGAQPDKRCGRAVLSDLHVGTGGTALAEQEAALEFMFFDLAACVIDDGKVPVPPPPN